MSEDELKLTRRVFLEHSAAAAAASSAWCGIAMKTDALARAEEAPVAALIARFDPILPYVYHDEP